MVLGERLPGRVEQCGGFFYMLELDISYQYQLSIAKRLNSSGKSQVLECQTENREPRTKNQRWSAGVAQLVEHNLAKVGVESSSLFSRSRWKEYASKTKEARTCKRSGFFCFTSRTRGQWH